MEKIDFENVLPEIPNSNFYRLKCSEICAKYKFLFDVAISIILYEYMQITEFQIIENMNQTIHENINEHFICEFSDRNSKLLGI